jgi:uncharacterized protein with HXXEE motif
MERRSARVFLALIIAQVAHSIEEYAFRLYEVFEPARLVSSLFSRDLEWGFVAANVALVLFGFWCYFTRVRRGGGQGRAWAWLWTILEAGNGTGHLALAAARGGYFPGAATAPLLLVCSGWLGITLARARDSAA